MNSNILEKIVIFILLCSGVLQIYALGDFSFYFVSIALFGFVFLLSRIKLDVLPKPLLFYFVFFYTISILNVRTFLLSSIFDTFILIPLFCYTVFYCIRDLKSFLSIYKFLAIVFIAFFFIQELAYYTTGTRISGIIHSLPLAITQDSGWLSEHDTSYRSTSFFSEPAHFAQFLLPLLSLQLFGGARHKNVLFSLTIIVVLVLLQSGNAILGSIPIVIAYVIKMWSNKSFSNWIKYIFLILLLIGFATYYVTTNAGQGMLLRSETMTSDYAGYITSTYLRVFRGWDLYSLMSFKQQLFGLGNRESVIYFINHSSIYDRFISDSDIYFNGAQSVFIYSGIFGAFIFGWFIYSAWKNTSFAGKTILSIMVVFMFVASNFLQPSMAICLIMAKLLDNTKTNGTDKRLRRVNNHC